MLKNNNKQIQQYYFYVIFLQSLFKIFQYYYITDLFDDLCELSILFKLGPNKKKKKSEIKSLLTLCLSAFAGYTHVGIYIYYTKHSI